MMAGGFVTKSLFFGGEMDSGYVPGCESQYEGCEGPEVKLVGRSSCRAIRKDSRHLCSASFLHFLLIRYLATLGSVHLADYKTLVLLHAPSSETVSRLQGS